MVFKKVFDKLLSLYLPRYITVKRLLIESLLISFFLVFLGLSIGLMIDTIFILSFSFILSVLIQFRFETNQFEEEIESKSRTIKIIIVSIFLFSGLFAYESLVFYNYTYPSVAFIGPIIGLYYWYKNWSFTSSYYEDTSFYVNPNNHEKLWKSASYSLSKATDELNDSNSLSTIYHTKQAKYKYNKLQTIYPSTISENNIAKYYSNAASSFKQAAFLGQNKIEERNEKVEEGLDWEERARDEAEHRVCDDCKQRRSINNMVWVDEGDYSKAKYCKQCYQKRRKKTNQRYNRKRKKRRQKYKEKKKQKQNRSNKRERHQNRNNKEKNKKENQRKRKSHRKRKKNKRNNKNRNKNRNRNKRNRNDNRKRKKNKRNNKNRNKNRSKSSRNKSSTNSSNGMSYSEALEILGCDKNSSEDEITKAYREKVKENHPDQGGDTEKLKKINKAYEKVK